jgi:predicted nucleotidyltransferase
MEQYRSVAAEPLSNEFLNSLVTELDNDDIVGITLGGSYVRGEATPYSDVDIGCFFKEEAKLPSKRFMYRNNRLISIAANTVSTIRTRLCQPEMAIFFVAGKRRILLDKDGSVGKLLQEIEAFTWESLQQAADEYASFQMMLLAEQVHKILSELLKGDDIAISYVTSELLFCLTKVMAVQRGVLVKSDSTYYQQVQAAVGRASAWTRHHRLVAGVDVGQSDITSVRARAVAALVLYRETVALLQFIMRPDHLEVAEQAVRIANKVAPHLK